MSTDNTTHRRISQNMIDAAVSQLVERYQPYKVVLFGSYAYGQPTSDSDVDLLVIMNTPIKEIEQAIQICQSLRCRFGLDLVVRTPKKLEERLALGDVFLREIMQKGKVLYEHADE